MKKSILTIVLVFVLSGALFAQHKFRQKLKEVQQKQLSIGRLAHAKSTFIYDSVDKVWSPELNYALSYNQGVLVQETATNNIGYNVGRTTYTYDGKNLTEQVVEVYGAGAWVNSYRLLLNYDQEGNLVKEEIQDWFDNTWNISFGLAREYDYTKNDTVTIVDSMWNGNEYEATQMIVEIYVPGTKNYLEMTMYTKDQGTNSWLELFRETYTYDLNTNLIELTKQSWIGNGWMNFMRFVDYHYDSLNHRVNKYTTQNWNNTSQQWNNYSIDTFEYYDYKGLVNTSYYITNLGLVPSTRSTFLNDSLMNQTVSKYESWNTQNNQWESMMHNESIYTYDIDSAMLSKTDLALVDNNRIDSTYKTVYYYGIASGQNDVRAVDVSIYPNPAKNYVKVKLFNVSKSEEIEVRLKNINGQTITSQFFKTDNIDLDVSNLSTGLYLLQVKSTTGVQTVKLSIK